LTERNFFTGSLQGPAPMPAIDVHQAKAIGETAGWLIGQREHHQEAV
jgi:hypothetical protein